MNAASPDAPIYPASARVLRIIITRPPALALSTAELLQAHAYPTHIEPLLFPTYLHCDLEGLHRDISASYGIIITSIHGLEWYRQQPDLPPSLFYVVGEQLAHAARSYGYAVVTTAPTVSALVPVLPRSPLVYLRGEEVTQPLASEGHITEYVVYRMKPATGFSADFLAFLEVKETLLCLFYSSRTARLCSDLLRRTPYCTPALFACCLSSSIAACLHRENFLGIDHAKNPTQGALLEVTLQVAKHLLNMEEARGGIGRGNGH